MLVWSPDDSYVLLVCLQETRGALSPGLAAKPSPARQADLAKRMQVLQNRLQVRATSQPLQHLACQRQHPLSYESRATCVIVAARLVSSSGGRAAPVRTKECAPAGQVPVYQASQANSQLSFLQSTLETWRAGLTWIISRAQP